MTLAAACWRRLDLPGSDAARLLRSADGVRLEGKAVFHDARGPAALDYRVDLAPDGSTRLGTVSGFIGDTTVALAMERGRAGWVANGRAVGLAGAVDLDLGFTPATNAATIRRLALPVGAEAVFDVAWLDPTSLELRLLPQRYRRTAAGLYRYASPEHGYMADLTVDAAGFVQVYPGLWDAA